MKTLTIYIASSWKHQFGVDQLTRILRHHEHEVLNFMEEPQGQPSPNDPNAQMNFDEWVAAHGAAKQAWCLNAINQADLVIYYGPSGCDAWAEVGFANAVGTPVLGLWTAAEQIGINRLMVFAWAHDYEGLMGHFESFLAHGGPAISCLECNGEGVKWDCPPECANAHHAPCDCKSKNLGQTDHGGSGQMQARHVNPDAAPSPLGTSPQSPGGGASYPGSGI